jgi:hypothetical protein
MCDFEEFNFFDFERLSTNEKHIPEQSRVVGVNIAEERAGKT